MKYVALLRGIGPGNPNMQNEKLRRVLEDLGFSSVQSVISSGNILFESEETDTTKLEATIQSAWPDKLGFTSTTIIRSQLQLEALVKRDPFKGLTHGPNSYLLITFFKHVSTSPFRIPYHPKNKPYYFNAQTNTELCSVTDNTIVKTTDLMSHIEKHFGKEITSRTWLTVQRMLKKMSGV